VKDFVIKKNIFQFNKLKVQMDRSPFLKDLRMYIEKHDIKLDYICDYCQQKFRAGDLPAYSILNNLFVHNVPDKIASLKQYEKNAYKELRHFKLLLKWKLLLIKNCPKGKWYKK